MAKSKGKALAKIVREVKQRNPTGSLGENLIAGAGAYAGSRVVSRIAHALVNSKWPQYAKHADPIASAASLAGVWIATSKVRKLEPYKVPAMIGAVIALIQSVLTTWMPGLAYQLGILPASAPMGQLSGAPQGQSGTGGEGEGEEEPDPLAEYLAQNYGQEYHAVAAHLAEKKGKGPEAKRQEAQGAAPEPTVEEQIEKETEGLEGFQNTWNTEGLEEDISNLN